MPAPIKISKQDAKRAFIKYHLTPCPDQKEAFQKLRSIQFDPIAPAGCNHDLVLQARVHDYKVGDWETLAYQERHIYDGWDKQASLVPYEGWPLRRIFHQRHRDHFKYIFDDHAYAVDAILKELQQNGPLMPKQLEFQERKAEWKTTWSSPNLSKRTLRALWHSGLVMTTGRVKGHHVYDLTERIVPAHLFNQPMQEEADALRELILERYRAVGLLKPNAPPEVWSYQVLTPVRKTAHDELIATGEIIPVEVEGVKAHATPAFLALLDTPELPPKVTFLAPLDQFMWDRKMVAHLFDFDYAWEIYIPEAKRRWSYYVLPVLFGDNLVARAEFSSRKGVLELKFWLDEPNPLPPAFYPELEKALKRFMAYSHAQTIQAAPAIDPKIKSVVESIEI